MSPLFGTMRPMNAAGSVCPVTGSTAATLAVPLTAGTIQPHGLLLVEQLRDEVRGQAGLVVLRLHPVEAQAVVERQAVVGFQLSCRYHSTFQ